jgi:hypothetical protein
MLVERCQGDPDSHRASAENVEISQDQRALGQHVHLKTPLQQQFAAAARQLALGFDRLPAVARAADEDLARRGPAQLPFQHLDGVQLHVDKRPPGLRVGMKSLHEPGVAVHAAMGAARVAVQRIVAQRATVEDRLADGLANDGFCGCSARISHKSTAHNVGKSLPAATAILPH